eukprot:scpid82106/ scgid22798/ Sentrin-specific protease 8; Deneddylase-1; NEDD8-specific protease 1; Sentrin/SUMO-specific protease SENP8
MSSETVLNYYDSCLRTEDVALLGEGNWLNDKLIAFWFEYLEHTILEGRDDVALVTPDVTQMIKFLSVEELTVILEPLALASRKLVLLAVNDNADNSGSGGSHWSLLCYHREQNAFFHFDSMRQLNARYAKQLQEKLCRLINCAPQAEHVPIESPRQVNYTDCGVYVMLYAEYIAENHKARRDFAVSIPPKNKIDFPLPGIVQEKRSQVRACISSLAQGSSSSACAK